MNRALLYMDLTHKLLKNKCLSNLHFLCAFSIKYPQFGLNEFEQKSITSNEDLNHFKNDVIKYLRETIRPTAVTLSKHLQTLSREKNTLFNQNKNLEKELRQVKICSRGSLFVHKQSKIECVFETQKQIHEKEVIADEEGKYNKELQIIRKENADLKQQLHELRQNVTVNKYGGGEGVVEETQSIEDIVQHLQSLLKKLTQQHEAQAQANNQLNNEIQQLAKTKQKAHQELVKSMEFVEQLRQSNARVTEELTRSEEQREQLQKQLKNLVNEVDELRSENTNMENDLTKTKKKTKNIKKQSKNQEFSFEVNKRIIISQEIIEQEQERGDSLEAELKNKEKQIQVLHAQKEDLMQQLHSKIQSDVTETSVASEKVKELLEEIAASKNEHETLRLSLDQHREDLLEKEEEIASLNRTINSLKLELNALAGLEQDFTALQGKCKHMASELETKTVAFNNLQLAYNNLQVQFHKLEEIQKNEKLAAENNKMFVYLLNLFHHLYFNKYESATKQLAEVRTKLTHSQKYILRLENENSTLRNGLQKTINKLKAFSSNENQVDRRLVNKLLVTFFERLHNNGDTQEVIQLMGNILNFSEEEKRNVMLENETNANVNKIKDGKDTKNLADLWVEFLLTEMDEDGEDTSKHKNSNESVIPSKEWREEKSVEHEVASETDSKNDIEIANAFLHPGNENENSSEADHHSQN
ncbi:hypothetical protein RFI_05938 [Reticulomyxa filosa]|uniref:GRIP domain-containing protein n=1 Tax=Reticulomyxa filosa TaxID=46433 RepID=X6P0W8_RETFI|nr:hypothetical protein RFI_05938 [Reticulomyxa filosa]|eukprot:ETO31182.1 hypothetical protein RFI_05938 [Reticulomyxa filosa]